jgi:hypothetical protein
VIVPGEVISYFDICREEGTSLQQGMNFRVQDGYSVILMSRRKDAPYNDHVEDEGRTLIYEGHDVPNRAGGPDSPVKQQVWKRDKGACVICGNKDNLHFDHVIPYSRGGSSLVAENIQLLCARHNLSKRDRIE